MKILSFIVVFFIILNTNIAIEFEYYGMPLNTECFGEPLGENTLMIGEIRTSTLYVAVKVYDPNGKVLFSKTNETISKFSLTAQISGTFQVCIDNLSRQIINYVVKINTGVFARDYSEMAEKKNVKPIEIILKKTEDMVKEIQNTANNFISKREESIDKVEFINIKIMVFSTITILILIILGIFQSNYLKKFFKSKKLI